MNFYSSDFHLGHASILKYRPQFSSIEEHDSVIFDQLASLSKRDIITIHGDFLFDCPNYSHYISQLSKMSCRIKLIMGNHDSLNLYREPKFEIQLPLFSYKNMWMSHAPIHPQELRSRTLNIHGHLHGGSVRDYRFPLSLSGPTPDSRYFNVNLDNHNFKFVTLDQIIAHRDEVQSLELQLTQLLGG